MDTPTTLLYYRKVFLITFILAFMLTSNLVEARTIPRTNSRSFRFPSGSGDEEQSSSSSVLFVAKTVPESNSLGYTDESNQGRNAIITLDSNPIKTAVPQSPIRPTEDSNKNGSTSFDEETVSSEILEGDLGISEENDGEIVAVNDDNEKNGHNPAEDVALREALCPSTINASVAANKNVKLRYDLRAGKCAEVGKRKHCGQNMIFVAEIDSSAYGYCECDFENKILRKQVKQYALFNRTPLVYHAESKACYRLYEKSYCNEGEWLVLSREKKGPICEPNHCAGKHVGQNSIVHFTSSRRRASKLLTPTFWTEGSTATESTGGNERLKNASESSHANGVNVKSIWVPLNGTGPCVKLFEKNLEHCEAVETVMFRVGDIVPKCGIVGRGVEGRALIRNACPPGSYYSIIGRCQADWDF